MSVAGEPTCAVAPDSLAANVLAGLDGTNGTRVAVVVPNHGLDPRSWGASTIAALDAYGRGASPVPLIAPSEVADLGFLAAATVDDPAHLGQLRDDLAAVHGCAAGPKGADPTSATSPPG